MAFERSFTRQFNILPNREMSFNPVPPKFSAHDPSPSQFYPMPTQAPPFVQSSQPTLSSAQLAHSFLYREGPLTFEQNDTESTSQYQKDCRQSQFLQGDSGHDTPDWSKQHQAELFTKSTGSNYTHSSSEAPNWGNLYPPSAIFSGKGERSVSSPTDPPTQTYVAPSSPSFPSHSSLSPLEGNSRRRVYDPVEYSPRAYQSSLAPMFDLVAQRHLPTSYLPSTLSSTSSPPSSSLSSDSQSQSLFQQNLTYDTLPATTEFQAHVGCSNTLRERQRTSTSPQSGLGTRPITQSLQLSTKTSSKRSLPPRDLPRRSYSCPVCGRAFSRPSGLDSHERSHSGAKPYECLICRRPFSAFSNLKRHMIVHPGVNFEHVSVHDLPFLVYDESHNPPLFWSERGAPVMEVSTDIAFSLLQESNSDFHY